MVLGELEQPVLDTRAKKSTSRVKVETLMRLFYVYLRLLIMNTSLLEIWNILIYERMFAYKFRSILIKAAIKLPSYKLLIDYLRCRDSDLKKSLSQEFNSP